MDSNKSYKYVEFKNGTLNETKNTDWKNSNISIYKFSTNYKGLIKIPTSYNNSNRANTPSKKYYKAKRGTKPILRIFIG